MRPSEIKEEGMNSYMADMSASDCPYSFQKSAFWDNKDYTGFESVRWKLDAWMSGWLEAERKGRAPVLETTKREER